MKGCFVKGFKNVWWDSPFTGGHLGRRAWRKAVLILFYLGKQYGVALVLDNGLGESRAMNLKRRSMKQRKNFWQPFHLRAKSFLMLLITTVFKIKHCFGLVSYYRFWRWSLTQGVLVGFHYCHAIPPHQSIDQILNIQPSNWQDQQCMFL